jgi:hypothetical protein
MNVLKISRAAAFRRPAAPNRFYGVKNNYSGYVVILCLMLLWAVVELLVIPNDPTIGSIDPNIWLLLLLSLITFIVITGLCWWLLQRIWAALALPALNDMVLQFNSLLPWQQLGFYWASLCLLLMSAVGVLSAIL